MDELISILRVGSVRDIKKILKNSDAPPAEILLPFMLKKCLQKEKMERKDMKYVKACFELFTKLSCLNDEEHEKAAYLHRLALVFEAVYVLHNSTDYLEAGQEVMALFNEFMCKYKHEKEAKQFTYFGMICNRRSRFLEFKKESHKMAENLEKRMKRRGIPLADEFIKRM